MKRFWLRLVLAGLVVAALGTAQASAKSCKLDGVWYGFNTLGYDLVMTITKTGGGRYTAIVMNPETNAQGEFVFKRQGEYDTTWLTYIDGGPLGFPGQWLAFHMTGDVEKTGCNSWTAVTNWDGYLFTPGLGEDPFANPPVMTFPGVELFYTRMP